MPLKRLATLLAIVAAAFAMSVSGQTRRIFTEEAKFTDDTVWTKQSIGAEDFRSASGTKNGVVFKYWSDGSGAFESAKGRGLEPRAGERVDNWRVSCDKDVIDDSKTCYLSRGDALFVIMRGGGDVLVSVGTSNDPGSSIAIRVDGKPAYLAAEKTGFTGVKAIEVIEAIRNGKSVVTRYSKFPGGGKVDTFFDTYGFAEAIEYLKWGLATIK